MILNNLGEVNIDYHRFDDFEDIEKGEIVTRYTCSKRLTETEIETLSKYSNVKVKIGGARYKWDPNNIVYDVVYVSLPIEEDSEEGSFENLDDNSYQYSDNILLDYTGFLDELDKEVSDFNPSLFAQVNECINNSNTSILFYKQLSEAFPENKNLFDSLAEAEMGILEKLQSLKDSELKTV